jgi:hypothetical protein
MLVFSKLKSTLEKARANTTFKDPENVEEFIDMITSNPEIFSKYGSFTDQEPFYYRYVELNEKEKMVIFINMKTVRKADKYEKISADGTFYIKPKIFSQLYMLHFLYKERVRCIK